MKKILNAILLLSILTTISCNNTSDVSTYDPSLMPEGNDSNAITTGSGPNDTARTVINNGGQTPIMTEQTQRINLNTAQGAAVQQPIVPTTTTTKKGLNPPHGETGHDCAIPVGAPLGSKPAATQTNNAPAVITAPTTSTSQVVTPAGMNPPHGEPGHRCDISVGEPLNSKPTTAPVVQDSMQ